MVRTNRLPSSLFELSDQARSFAAAALSSNTQRAYRAQWRLWTEHATTNKHHVLPANPADLANWLAGRAVDRTLARDSRGVRPSTRDATIAALQNQPRLDDGHLHDGLPTPTGVGRLLDENRSSSGDARGDSLPMTAENRGAGQTLSTLRSALAAVRFAHLAAGHPFDSAHPAIALVLRGVARTRLSPPRQAPPLTPETISGLLETVSDNPRDCRDAALLALGYCFARRRSELSGLDLENIGTGTGILLLKGPNLEIRLYRSKAQRLFAEEVYIVPKVTNRLAVDVIMRWISKAHIMPGEPVFRRVFKSGKVSGKRLDPQSIALIIKHRLKSYYEAQGVPPDAAAVAVKRFSGHSLRVGFAVASAEAGASVLAIQSALGHKSPAMAARYAQAAEKARTSPHLLPGVSLDKPLPRKHRRPA